MVLSDISLLMLICRHLFLTFKWILWFTYELILCWVSFFGWPQFHCFMLPASTEIYWQSKFSGREINVQDFLILFGNDFWSPGYDREIIKLSLSMTSCQTFKHVCIWNSLPSHGFRIFLCNGALKLFSKLHNVKYQHNRVAWTTACCSRAIFYRLELWMWSFCLHTFIFPERIFWNMWFNFLHEMWLKDVEKFMRWRQNWMSEKGWKL